MRAVLALLAVVAICPCAIAMAQVQEQTVADGVFSGEQATRGGKTYRVFCGNCHAADLSGDNSADSGAPPLRRLGFMEGSNVDALFTKIRQTMPLDAPAALTSKEYLDVVAYILQQNGFPPGPDEMRSDPDELRNIRIVRSSDSAP